MSGQHARYSPSAAYRRLACPPSLVLEEQYIEEGESVYAAEGTAGHLLAEHLIRQHLGLTTTRPESEFYTEELMEAVEDYVSFALSEIEEARTTCHAPVILVEQRVDASAYVAGCFGTADLAIITDSLLHIIDLKLGKGVEVSAQDNPQLMIYGLGMLEAASPLYDITSVRLTIYQPRLNNASTWTITPEELNRWGRQVLKPRGAMALMGVGEFAAGSWCRFCRARNQCRARAEEYLALAKLEFQAPALLSDTELVQVLSQADELSRWAQDVYAYAQDEAIAHGKRWPGYKLVEGRSNRRYISEELAAKAAAQAGYKDIYKQSLMSITEMERLMGKSTFNNVLGSLVCRPQGKITLVPEKDKREAIDQNTAKAEFTEEKS